MRKEIALAAGFLALALVIPAAAQTLTPQNALTGVSPRQIRMQPIDTSRAVVPTNIANSFRPPRPPQTFTLSRFFPKITAGPWPPKMPNLNLFKSKAPPAAINPQQAFRGGR